MYNWDEFRTFFFTIQIIMTSDTFINILVWMIGNESTIIQIHPIIFHVQIRWCLIQFTGYLMMLWWQIGHSMGTIIIFHIFNKNTNLMWKCQYALLLSMFYCYYYYYVCITWLYILFSLLITEKCTHYSKTISNVIIIIVI